MANEMQMSETTAEAIVEEEVQVQPSSGDEFDQLRQKSVRTSAAYAEIDAEEAPRGFSPNQRLVVALLVLLNILIFGFAILLATGRIAV